MMISKKTKPNSLSNKICEALNAPELQDPEDDIYEDTKAKTVQADSDFEEENKLEAELSSFRKQNAKLLQDIDKKYAGKTVNRKSLYAQDDDYDSDERETDDDNKAADSVGLFVRKQYENSDTNAESYEEDLSFKEISEDNLQMSNSDKSEDDIESFNDDSDVSDDDSNITGNNFDDANMNDCENNASKNESDFKHVNHSNVSEDVQKGNAVRQQLHIWEKLMEMRIHSQKLLLSSNKLPRHDEFSAFVLKSPEFKVKIQETTKMLTNLLSKYLDMQQLFLKKYSETKDLLEDKSDNEINDDSNEELLSDTEDEQEDDPENAIPRKRRKVSHFPNILSERHEKYTSYRNSVIQKWHDKVRVASGVINHKNLGTSSLIQHIEHILYDKDRLRKRTQLKRSKYEILSLSLAAYKQMNECNAKSNDIVEKKIEEEYNPEIFDDDDFYHQLLRELIEYKTANITDPVQLSKQSIELQQLRNKMKRKIDTKATKGRRIRYSVHPKLVNFMAPEENSTWTDEAKDELFGSVFGKNIQQKG